MTHATGWGARPGERCGWLLDTRVNSRLPWARAPYEPHEDCFQAYRGLGSLVVSRREASMEPESSDCITGTTSETVQAMPTRVRLTR